MSECSMKLRYTVSKLKEGDWYAHMVGYPGIPVWGSFGNKNFALHRAAESMGLPYEEYMALRRKEGTQGENGGVIGYEPEPGKVR